MPAAAVRAPALKPGHASERSGGASRGGRSGQRPLPEAPRPRRVSGPARRAAVGRPLRRGAGSHQGIALRVAARLERLSRLRLASLGRTWIALVAFALIGIVTLQLVLLKLNASIGRALEHEALLQRQNAALSIENSELAASPRVEAGAERIGMELVPPGALRFLAVRPGFDASRAAAALSTRLGAPAAGSAEASAGSLLTPGQPSGSAAGAEPSGATASGAEASSAGATASSAGSQAEESRGASGAGASTTAPERLSSSSGEPATHSEASQNPTTAPSPATAPGGSDAAEAGPAGGTQAAPRG